MSPRLAAIKAALAHDSTETVRVFRVDHMSGSRVGDTPPSWYDLPAPQYDTVWGYADGYTVCEKRREAWGDWKCAASVDTAEKWWPSDVLDAYIEAGDHVARIYEVPKDAALWCGTQYIYNPTAARRVMEIR